MTKAPSTFEMEMPSTALSNIAWSRLREVMDGGLECIEPDPSDIQEAEFLLAFKKALSERADFVLIRLRYDGEKSV